MNAVERIDKLLNPRSIAIVGASPAPNKLAGQLIPALREGGYQGEIYPVNPRYQEVAGLACYGSVAQIPAEVDHCVIVVGKERVPQVLQECRAKRVPGASIYTSGYAEASAGGHEAQQTLEQLAQGMTFIGPNCMGFSNLAARVMAAPSAVLKRAQGAGDVALVSQSGGLAYATIAYFAQRAGLGFSHVVNTGNSAGVSYGDLLEYMFQDPATRVVLAVTEAERAACEVIDAVRRLGLRKPVVLLKLGRGQTGTRMALSHTGSLAGDYRLVRDVAQQHGIVCASDADDALGLCELLRHGFGAAHAQGIASLCISGGNITLFADQADAHGLRFAELEPATEARLAEVLPDYISVHNPIDITALGYENPGLHAAVLSVLLADPAVRTVVPILTTLDDYTEVCGILARVREETGCDMIVLWSGGSYETQSREILRKAGIPVVHSASLLAGGLERLRRAAARRQAGAPVSLALASAAGSAAMSEGAAFQWLGERGVAVPAMRACARDGLADAARELGYPLVIKADSTETHISDQDGVILNIRNDDELAHALARVAQWGSERGLALRYLPGHELVAGTFAHPQLGLVLMVGSGGQWVELLKDVRFVALPAGAQELADALESTLVGRALREGYRGASGFEQAVQLLCALADAALRAAPAVTQIELNPVTVGKHGAAAVDAAIYWQA
ncbi:acetate--CoA ligase family protein [Achromobacter aegrifaciens]|uniref:acetate--CoA ligase family protein n=1 Tax=Achromobacter aegrifaciens TaxID=1287736 RepID=UPI000F73A7E7|nr:acetate--CoA ligase family protein [Achromobacter aegrifaciens]RSF03237.1 acetyl-CoA synthetase [Achromobacter aegrifaciens]